MLEECPKFLTFLSVHLPHLEGKFRRARLHWLYRHLRKNWDECAIPVKTRLHGYTAWINGGNPYPFIVETVLSFNAPLVELCHLVFSSAGRPINFVDVGSAIGDSVLLINERCPDMVAKFVCIEGDEEFFGYLSKNLHQFDNVELVRAMLAGQNSQTKSLVKHHKGTALAEGLDTVAAVRLDSLSLLKETPVDLLKIDVDGFDGEVLTGATGVLNQHKPAVIFEWHPKLFIRAGNDPLAPFASLQQSGYDRFAWFTNVGNFSHFSGPEPSSVILKMSAHLLASTEMSDPHYDIVALHPTSGVDEAALAALAYGRKQALSARNGQLQRR